jgi:hypothetical protein
MKEQQTIVNNLMEKFLLAISSTVSTNKESSGNNSSKSSLDNDDIDSRSSTISGDSQLGNKS